MTSGSRFRIEKYGRHFAVYDVDTLVCLAVYRLGAAEVIRRLTVQDASPTVCTQEQSASIPAREERGS